MFPHLPPSQPVEEEIQKVITRNPYLSYIYTKIKYSWIFFSNSDKEDT